MGVFAFMVLLACKFALVAESGLVLLQLGAQKGAGDDAGVDAEGSDIQVPRPINVGTDGNPALPLAPKLLESSTEAFEGFSKQAVALNQFAAKIQSSSEMRLVQQREMLLTKLHAQEEQSRVIVQHNTALSQDIEQLDEETSYLKRTGTLHRNLNNYRRGEVQALRSKLAYAMKLVTDTLVQSDANGTAETVEAAKENLHNVPPIVSFLQVDSVAAGEAISMVEKSISSDQIPAPSSADNLVEKSVDGEVQSDAAAEELLRAAQSLKAEQKERDAAQIAEAASAVLQDAKQAEKTGLRTKITGLVQALDGNIAELESTERQSEADLMAAFIQQFKAGSKRHAALAERHEYLTAVREAKSAAKAKASGEVATVDSAGQDIDAGLTKLKDYTAAMEELVAQVGA